MLSVLLGIESPNATAQDCLWFSLCCCSPKRLNAVADGAGGKDWEKHLILY